MSVTVSKADGVTVFTLTSDPQSPVLYSVSQHLKKIQAMSQSVLGALHIMFGLLKIGFGAVILGSVLFWWQEEGTLVLFGFGAAFMLFGIVCILSEKCPCPCLVVLNVILNLAGVASAIFFYTFMLAPLCEWTCRRYEDYYYMELTTQDCTNSHILANGHFSGMFIGVIVLSVLEVFITISSAVLSIKALRSKEKKENKSTEDLEQAKTKLVDDPSC